MDIATSARHKDFWNAVKYKKDAEVLKVSSDNYRELPKWKPIFLDNLQVISSSVEHLQPNFSSVYDWARNCAENHCQVNRSYKGFCISYVVKKVVS